MKFGDLEINDKFTRQSSPDLIWHKQEPLRNMGVPGYDVVLKPQNAACQHRSGVGPWHTDHISDDEEVTLATSSQ